MYGLSQPGLAEWGKSLQLYKRSRGSVSSALTLRQANSSVAWLCLVTSEHCAHMAHAHFKTKRKRGKNAKQGPSPPIFPPCPAAVNQP